MPRAVVQRHHNPHLVRENFLGRCQRVRGVESVVVEEDDLRTGVPGLFERFLVVRRPEARRDAREFDPPLEVKKSRIDDFIVRPQL